MVEAIASIYLPRFAAAQAYMLVVSRYRLRNYLRWFWSISNFSKIRPSDTVLTTAMHRTQIGIWFTEVSFGMAALAIVLDGLNYSSPGQLQVGLALLIATPILAVHMFAFFVLLAKILSSPLRIKSIGKKILCNVFERQFAKLRAGNEFKIVAVVGSVGKTSTKLAIAKTLEASYKVCYQMGNYNDALTVPLVIFGHNMPSMFNLSAWIGIIKANNQIIKSKYPYDVIVLELGTDGLGQIEQFSYLKPDITVVTAITPEHMENFGGMGDVATEELSVADFSKQLLINIDDTPKQYLENLKYLSYGSSKDSNYQLLKSRPRTLSGQNVTIKYGKTTLNSNIDMLGSQGAKIALAAVSVAHLLGLKKPAIQKGLKGLKPFAGRMQVLKGIKSSFLIDDTYNSSPPAAIAALDVLYKAKATQKIAILGNMNELGSYSREAHEIVGRYCEPKKLDYVLSIGRDANKYLAAEAEARGCRVERFNDPYTMGEFVKRHIRSGAVVLAKGSQNRVFAEESIKLLLAKSKDSDKLVRQSSYWLDIKSKQFKVKS